MRAPGPDRPAEQGILARLDHVDADGLLELEDQPRADRLDDRRGARLLTVDGVVEVDVLFGIDVGHRASAHDDRDGVREQLTPDDEDAGGARTSDELVRRQHDGVLGCGGIVRAHVDVDVRRGSGVIPHRQRAVAVEEGRHGIGVGEDPRHVAGCAERSDDERAITVLLQGALQGAEVDMAIAILGDRHHVGDGLAPREFVAVMLEGSEEDDGPLPRGDARAEPVALVEVGRDAKVEDADKSVDGSRATAPGEDHAGGFVAVDGVADDPTGILAEPRGLQPGAAGFGVGVRVAGQHLVADEVLDEGERPAAGGVVRVGHPARPEGPVHDAAVTRTTSA